MALTPSATPQHQPSGPSDHSLQPTLNLPAPQTFDILPALHELLSRIEHTSLAAEASNGGASPDPNAHYADLPPLDPKDLPTEVLAIKARIRRALRELEKLPDMRRSVGEQREEIAMLEAKVQAQREMIRRLGEMAGQMGVR